MNIKTIALAALALSCAPAWAGVQDFKLVNETGAGIRELYVSPASADDWEEDVLDVDTLSEGQSVRINSSRETDECLYDLKVVHDDGDTAEWTRFDLCEISEIRLSYDKDGDPIATTA